MSFLEESRFMSSIEAHGNDYLARVIGIDLRKKNNEEKSFNTYFQ